MKMFFRFRRWYCSNKLPFHDQWVTRVMRREYGLTKDTFDDFVNKLNP